ncbi:VOC family protein [uncultured Tenacibaculum sp.]|uniref:VOC family protein n=1 Tax=uncultured Tenacibaculum sp. TaxID=174713 RepID=UPI0026389156|nr:VOC family protein [uncultured Tenacibaculum sp.]
MNRLMTNTCSDNLIKSRDFYSKIFKLNIAFESDWFIHLVTDNKNLELGIIDRTNEIVPEEFQNKPQGFYITFVVDNADEIFNIAVAESFEIVQEPADTFYGQRRVLLKDPDGTLIDVSSPIENFSF